MIHLRTDTIRILKGLHIVAPIPYNSTIYSENLLKPPFFTNGLITSVHEIYFQLAFLITVFYIYNTSKKKTELRKQKIDKKQFIQTCPLTSVFCLLLCINMISGK